MKIAKNLVAGSRGHEVIVARGAAGTNFAAQHALHHLRMAVAPGGEQLVDLHQRQQQVERQVEDGFVAVEIDEQGSDRRAVRQPQFALSAGLLMRSRIEHRLEVGIGTAQHAQPHLLFLLTEVSRSADGSRLLLEHIAHRLLIMCKKIEVAKLQEGRALQPLLHLVKQRLARGQLAELCLLCLLEDRSVRLVVVREPARLGQTEHHLHHPKLEALEARGREEIVAEVEKIEGRHGLQHPNLLNEQLQDFGHPLEAGHRIADVALIDMLSVKHSRDGRQLVDNLLEPQFVHLMHNDEKHLVVGGLRRQLRRAHVLRGEELVELEIAVVVDG